MAAVSTWYYRARYYDPASGRFITEDPAGFAAGFNFYRYLSNYPAGSRDPSGLNPDDDSGVPDPMVRAIVIPITIYGYYLCANKVKHDFNHFSREGHPRYAHCMASCNLAKQCGSKTAAFFTGYGREFLDVLDCVRTSKAVSCSTAMQRSDIEDNAKGRGCPKDEPNGLGVRFSINACPTVGRWMREHCSTALRRGRSSYARTRLETWARG